MWNQIFDRLGGHKHILYKVLNGFMTTKPNPENVNIFTTIAWVKCYECCHVSY